MKTIVLGDTHGRTIWKDILTSEQTWDRVIFIGDYVDTHYDISGSSQLENLHDIIAFKKDNKDKVILLVGNHDYQYWDHTLTDYCQYSGAQRNMAHSFELTFQENKELFQMCFLDEHKRVFSHAGLTETFVEQRIGTFSEKNVNDVWKHKPASFGFYFGDFSGCGDDVHQSCIWVRPLSLYRDQISYLQFVGHTEVHKIDHSPKSERRGFYLIDCLENRQYVVLEDEKVVIKQLGKDEVQ